MRISAQWMRLFAILLLFGGVRALATDPVEDAVQNLSTVSAFVGVGFAGRTSKGEINLRFLVSYPGAIALQALERPYATGDPEGRAYALAGLKKLNPDRFKELLAAAEDSTESVVVMHDCFRSTTSLGMTASQIDRGDFSSRLEAGATGFQLERP
jgi:hypothetical protein